MKLIKFILKRCSKEFIDELLCVVEKEQLRKMYLRMASDYE